MEHFQDVYKRMRYLARLAEPPVGMRSLSTSPIPPWVSSFSYTNALLRRIEQTRKWLEPTRGIALFQASEWSATAQTALSRLDDVEADAAESESTESQDQNELVTITDIGTLSGRSREELGRLVAEVTAAVFYTLTGQLEPDESDPAGWTLRACEQAFNAGAAAAALWDELTEDTED
ncbi:hypothetical protein ACQEU8_35945 [Streptomyces sp. CA-250714]|uniref:hypothetical protein n=1 Tax=Streptomyces sp. CA-250714 TaxID=3240060 RepID=UPI003D8E4A62